MENTNVVVIPIQRYDELLDLETRVNVVVERISHEEYLAPESLLWILGTELAVETAYSIEEQKKEERREYLKNHKLEV